MGQRIRYRTFEMLDKIYSRFGTQPFVYVAVKDVVPAPRNIVQLVDLGLIEPHSRFYGTTVWQVTEAGEEKIARQKKKWAATAA